MDSTDENISPEMLLRACVTVEKHSLGHFSSNMRVINASIYVSMLEKNMDNCKCPHEVAEGEKVFLFDIDNTIFNANNGMYEQMRERIYKIGQMFLQENIVETCELWFKTYGHTVKGLQKHIPEFRNEVWLEHFDEGLEIEKFVEKDEELKDILNRIPHRKWIYTNGTANYARRVLECMDLTDCFEGVFYFDSLDTNTTVIKPDPQAFQFIENFFPNVNAEDLFFFDDSRQNTETATSRGWSGYWVDNVVGCKETLRKLTDRDVD